MAASRTLFRAASHLPIVRDAASLAYAWHFGHASGARRLFRGVYHDFASAEAEIPSARNIGYDNEPTARLLLDERVAVAPYDYPAMFWLDRIIGGSRTLFDWGGYVGTAYFTFRKYVAYPIHLDWIVNDVPAVVALGNETIAREHLSELHFTTGFERLAEADILLASGSLQFIEDPFGPLERATTLPRYAIVNKTPMYDLESAVTLQNMGTAIAPYHLFNRRDFLARFEALGYEPIDTWTNPGLGCEIPFFKDHSIHAFSGYFFERTGNVGRSHLRETLAHLTAT